MRIRLVLLLALSCAFFLLPAHAQQARITIGGDPGWTIDADRITGNQRENIIEAEGRVALARGEERLQADYVRYNEKTRMVEMRGNVLLTSPEFRLTCERMELNLDRNVGTIYSGTIFFPTYHYYVSGEELEKTGPDTFRLSRGRITTCDGTTPDWSLTARDITIKQEGYATARQVILSARDLPIFYTPYLIVPVKSKRQSGLLTPEVITSDLDGFGMYLPYFLALSDSKDMTFTVTPMTRRGVDLGLEFRYKDWGGQGTYQFDFLSDQDPPSVYLPDETERKTYQHRYWLRGKSDLTTASGLEVKFDLDYVSDPRLLPEFERMPFGFDRANDQFILEFNRALDEPRDAQRKTTLLASRYLSPMHLDMALAYTQEDPNSPNHDQTVQRLPLINLDLPRTAIGQTPLYFQMNAGYQYITREVGSRGHRLDIHPRLYWPSQLLGWLNVDPSLGVRQLVYYPYDVESASPYTGLRSREMFEAQVEASTRLSKVYELERFGVAEIKHRLQPLIAYRLFAGGNLDRLPYFDYIDLLGREEVIEYGLVNYLVAKKPREKTEGRAEAGPSAGYDYYEFLRFSLLRTYNLIAARQDLSNPENQRAVHGPWEAKLNLTFLPFVELEGTGVYDTYDRRWTGYSLDTRLKDRRGDELLLEYNYSFENYKEIHYKVFVTLTERLGIELEDRYSLKKGLHIEAVYALVYQAQCWAVRLEYVDRPLDRSLTVMFTLTGLGELSAYTFRPGPTSR
jgi:LPS-assembly protein